MLSNLSSYNIILASQSPRRQELLAGLDVPFTVRVVPDLEEVYPDTLSGDEVALYLAKHKASAYEHLLDDNTLVITADTIVWCDGHVLEKPVDEADAKRNAWAFVGQNPHGVYRSLPAIERKASCIFSINRGAFCQIDGRRN